MTGTAALAVLEATFLVIPGSLFDIPVPFYFLTLAVGICACFVHYITRDRAERLAELDRVIQLVETRLDSHELLDLDQALILAVGARRAHPRPRPRHRRRSRRHGDSNVFDLR